MEFNGQTIETDEEGYLIKVDDWSRELGQSIADTEGVEMSDDHWQVITDLREYYIEYDIAPMLRILAKGIGKKLGKDKGNVKYLYKLFPTGPARQACKIAGLPKPTGCV